ncbi:hypothetical protein SUDANB176_06557 [Streptomyces sp. enrichment culture]|uniref:hypothetical protein n=1 Tax=Streptomyces sp. enrichment culture TaxID=1795815 RepID=UPI003F55F66F
MTPRSSVPRRVAAGLIGAGRPGRRPPTIVQQRSLPLGRRLLMSLLGVRALPERPLTAPRPAPARSGRRRSAPLVPPTSPPGPADRQAPEIRYDEPAALLSEDRHEYERLLDEALRSAPYRLQSAAVGRRPNPEQLRTMALNARALVTAAAAAEYQDFVRIRALHRSVTAAPYAVASGRRGTGPTLALAVLGTLLGAAAALVLLLAGYALRLFDPDPAPARDLVTFGWWFAAGAAALGVLTMTGTVVTATRGSPFMREEEKQALSEEVERAREAWHGALLERGILPFLREALTEPGPAAERPRTAHSPFPGRGGQETGEPDRRPE